MGPAQVATALVNAACVSLSCPNFGSTQSPVSVIATILGDTSDQQSMSRPYFRAASRSPCLTQEQASEATHLPFQSWQMQATAHFLSVLVPAAIVPTAGTYPPTGAPVLQTTGQVSLMPNPSVSTSQDRTKSAKS